MSLFRNLAKKVKSTSAFHYLAQLLTSSAKQWNPETLKNNIKDLLVQIDFNLELAKSISESTVKSLADFSSLTASLVKEKLSDTLKKHYLEHTPYKKNNSDKLIDLINWLPGIKNVFFVVGSNGVGKTSFIAKLTYYLKMNQCHNKKILLVASDTFRAGAVKQLEELAQQLNVEIILPRAAETAGSLIYRTLREQNDYDLIIFDSAGRQYNNQNLLAEIKKQFNVMLKFLGRSPEEIFLIVDSTLGIYSHAEMEKMLDAIPITSLVLTKMDSTTRGGAIYNLKPKFPMPIKFISFGEKIQEIEPFNISDITTQLVNNIFSDDLLKI
ncbi:DNA/RNA helicase domain-containing protein [Candidatus Mycoplasma haematominutum]|uniref:Signal recognition particle receptor protein FtsY, alpha subunit n=1 Tax=Candidatus Mycoplasma haematominutum 'Birmingham 1' TaxID=1116213 RepID=G8C3X7_9MOLU|nr:DNA/RNA helicase domain-containing protein [Candidatus Mycoplasma haematominutum]CCE67025.1 signal recognition particle receptor protein FtsY, alpha subunit [Candidatus Mycoplasma haematominutum 'Birmingham 1']